MPFDLTFADLAARAVQYNARASVADFDAEMASYAALAARARAACPGILDLPYGMGRDERLDLFPVQAARQPAPLLVFVHGGYWRSQRKEDACSMVRAFTHAGVAVAVVEYTLLPEATLAEVVREIRSAVAWLYHNARTYGADPERIHVCGSSAGAHLAAMLLADTWQASYRLPQDVIKGIVGLSGLYDIRPLCDIGVNDWLRLHVEQAAALSPALHLPASAPDVVLCVGGLETDGFRHQTFDFHARLRARGLPVQLVDNTHCNHFNLVSELAEPESALFRATIGMIGNTPV
ncbi:alpha/beta hydrolase [Chitinasiproducens palmae]|uniref:Arylformamidase n=1 Tax=Chitinasiproducens palmae TaxID=1770053 RepID=A0A1H2PVI7_9BURK|nr:alpha/beta hydrolase [Chitinasiproducens palmae]SDV51315.1 arylformamidase [Chitinasiproducens palmae]